MQTPIKRNLFTVVVIICFSFSSIAQQSIKRVVHSFQLADSVFLLDGKPFQIISGEMHYPRVPREAWRDRMRKAKAMGLNTIGTYVFWNLHEPQQGKYDFTGNNDIAAFVKTAQEEGLWVILRPSPYVCAEWEFGGYPYWLQNIKGLEVRSKEPKYLQAYKNYIMQVGKQLAPLQVNHGGNILMVQVENEYGAYGGDREYLDINRKLFIEAGFDGLLYTCDPEPFLAKGNLPGKLFTSINGLDKPARIKQLIKQNNEGKGPFFVAEWYPAWFDWWGTQHHKVPAEKYTPGLDSVLSAGMSVNMYMFHGGTTRDFMNGANYNDHNPYEPQISSYDYDAPLDEAGNPTHKFMEFRKVIEKSLPVGHTLPDVPAAKPTIAIPAVSFISTTSLFDVLPAAKTNATPLTFEALNQAYGFVLYRTMIDGGRDALLKIKGLRDYGIVFINEIRVGVLDRRLKQDSLWLKLPAGKWQLDILVENLGRINYGPYLLKNKKGITEGVQFNGKELKGWQMFSLPFNTIESVSLKNSSFFTDAPVLKKGTFNLQAVGDTYLDLSHWGKGVVWVNGHNLGRYWNIGPQQTLYIPVEWLKKGGNEIIVLELLKPKQTQLQAIDKPILDQLNTRAADDETYKLVWSDEFDKNGAPDSTKWDYERGFVRNEELQWYQPQNAYCKKGHLIIEARRETKPNPDYVKDSRDWRRNRPDINYTAACLVTKGKQDWLYGRFEMRARIDISAGMWPAWWTLGVSKSWPANGEIDIMEYYKGQLLANIACLDKNRKAEWHSNRFPVDSLGADWSSGFHVWRMDWTKDYIGLYVDDQLLNKVAVDSLSNKDGSNFNPFRQPHYQLLNLAIGGKNGGDPSNTSFPRRFEIDYVRVYQKQNKVSNN
jgi:beta-galactosidase